MLKLLTLFFLFFAFTATSFYTIPVPAATGDTAINLNAYRGKKILIVNTASNSNYTPQYGSMEQLYQQYQDSLVVLAVPSNSFGNEPENDSAVASFIAINYHTTYPVAAKAEVTGGDVSELYNWLTSEDQNGEMSSIVKGDFQKYLIDENGSLIGVFAAAVDPMDSIIQNTIIGQ